MNYFTKWMVYIHPHLATSYKYPGAYFLSNSYVKQQKSIYTEPFWCANVLYDTEPFWLANVLYDTEPFWQANVLYDTKPFWQANVLYDTEPFWHCMILSHSVILMY